MLLDFGERFSIGVDVGAADRRLRDLSELSSPKNDPTCAHSNGTFATERHQHNGVKDTAMRNPGSRTIAARVKDCSILGLA